MFIKDSKFECSLQSNTDTNLERVMYNGFKCFSKQMAHIFRAIWILTEIFNYSCSD